MSLLCLLSECWLSDPSWLSQWYPSYADHVYKLEFLDKPKRCAPSTEGGLAFSAHRCLAPTSIAQYFPYFSALYRPLVTAFSTTSSRSLSLYWGPWLPGLRNYKNSWLNWDSTVSIKLLAIFWTLTRVWKNWKAAIPLRTEKQMHQKLKICSIPVSKREKSGF